MAKKILILNGGPRLNGNTAELIKAFTAGAGENGHTVIRFDLDRISTVAKAVCAAARIPILRAFRKTTWIRFIPNTRPAICWFWLPRCTIGGSQAS